MRILQLNVWLGKNKHSLLRFFRENQFDVICLQEGVWSEDNPKQLEFFAATVDEIKEASGLRNEIRSSQWRVGFSKGGFMNQGPVILTNQNISNYEVKEICGEFIEDWDFRKENQLHLYTAIKAELENGFTILTYHGYWQPEPIGNKDTIEMMSRVAGMIKGKGKVVMCGDLNVVAESPAMRELDFLKDLTAEHEVKRTLSGLGWDLDIACDHILVSQDVNVHDFQVLPDMISDHFPLVAEVS